MTLEQLDTHLVGGKISTGLRKIANSTRKLWVMTHLSITLILVVILQIIHVSKRSSYVFFMHVRFLMSKHKAHGVPQGRWGLLPPCKT